MGREFHNLTLRLKDCKEMSTPQEFCGDSPYSQWERLQREWNHETAGPDRRKEH